MSNHDGARGRGLISFAPGRSGHHVCRHYDRHAGCVAGCGLSRRRSDPRPLDGLPTKPGSDRTKGLHSPWAEPWWNAGRRARPRAEGRRKPLLPWRDPRAVFACGRCYPRLPAFRFPYFFFRPRERKIAGLPEPDPAPCGPQGWFRRSAMRPSRVGRTPRPSSFEARPVAPVTEKKTSLFDNTRARIALRERNVVYFVILRWRPEAALEGCTDQMPEQHPFEGRGACYRAGHFGPDPLAAASG